MNTSDLVNIIVGIATIYFFWQQNRIFERQNEIFSKQAEMDPVVTVANFSKLKRYWPMLGIVATWAFIGYDIYDRHHQRFGYDPNTAWDDSKPLDRVYSRKFTNETVVLDGKLFIDPIFDNITFAYNGKEPFGLNNPTYINHNGHMSVGMASRNKVVTMTMALFLQLAYANGCHALLRTFGADTPMDCVDPPHK